MTPDLLEQGYAARRDHRPADAHRLFVEAVTEARLSNDEDLLARALTGLGQAERDRKDFPAAQLLYQEAAALYRTLDNELQLAHTIRHAGDLLRLQDLPAQAESHYLEALALYRSHPETGPLDLANALRGYALIKHDPALWQEARALYASLNIMEGVAECDRHLQASAR